MFHIKWYIIKFKFYTTITLRLHSRSTIQQRDFSVYFFILFITNNFVICFIHFSHRYNGYYYLPKTLSICSIQFWEQVLWIGKICLLLFGLRQRLYTVHSTAGVWQCMLESSLSTSSHLCDFTFSRLCTRIVWCNF